MSALDRRTPGRSGRGVLVAMYTGLGLTVAAAIVPYLDSAHLLAEHIRAGYPDYTQARIDSAVTTYLIILSSIGALGVVAWLGTTWSVKAGKRWARPVATATFALGTSVALAALLTEDTSGDTGLAPLLGWIGMLPCLAGLLAIVLLWRQPQAR
ncbi:hypothetical protein AB0M22_45200 [Nocardia sp. NPDC051756]|uniref:hypothetical protein n=1 Tax=Nocardia sp. NPDC051756 TaxID=3154751 RepID=UPI0034485C3E